MGDWLERKTGTVVVGLVATVVVVLAVLTFAGGQTAKILSTVGASVGSPSDVSGAGAPEAPAQQPAPTDAGASPGPEVASADALAPAPGLLIVHAGSVALRVEEIAPAIDRLSGIVSAAGGYVAVSKTAGTGPDATATLEVRVPAAAWDPSLTRIRAVGSVLDQQIGSEEVTGQVIDLEARVANLRATEAALQAIMVKATKIGDILDVQDQLTQTRGEIEQLTAKAAILRDRAAFGSLTVALSLPAPAPTVTPVPSRPALWDPGRDAELASGKLVRIGQVGTTVAIWVAIVGLPIVVALLVGLGLLRIAWLGARRIRLVLARDTA